MFPDAERKQRTIAGERIWCYLGIGLKAKEMHRIAPDTLDNTYCSEKEEIERKEEKIESKENKNRKYPVHPVHPVHRGQNGEIPISTQCSPDSDNILDTLERDADGYLF